MTAPRHTVVRTSDQVALDVREHGDPADPTVVLVHGYPDTQELWSGVVARLQPDHHVVTYDVRGAGGSGAPAGLGGYALTRLSDDLLEVIEATTPADRAVHLVGHDWGAIQSWESAARPRVAIYAKNLPVEILAHPTDLKSPEYLAINPMGKLPALVLDDGTVEEIQQSDKVKKVYTTRE